VVDGLEAVSAPLLRQFVHGRWLPIIGAGFSRNAHVPSGDLPPDWRGLGKMLAADMPELEYDGPLDAISAYQQAFGRSALIDRLADLLRVHDAQPGPVHISFARLGFERVVTTNFDTLLEKAYESVQRACLPLVEESQLSNRNYYPGPRLLKLHGDLLHPNRLVLTEDDYDGFLSRNPLMATSLGALLIDHTAVLVGYSLDDPDLRQLLSLIKDRLGPLAPPLWTIQVDAPQHVINRYERRGVRVVNLPKKQGKSYGDQLRELFEALHAYWREELIDESQSTDERALADLKLPPGSSRTCYFAVPIELLSWYRENIFPIVIRSGFVPVAARDILTPPGTVTAKVDALIDRAALVIAEVAGPNALFELGLAMRVHSREDVLLIADQGTAIPADIEGYQIIIRPQDLTEAADALAPKIEIWFHDRSGRIAGYRGESEPERLIAAREYRAALIAAVAMLEDRMARSPAGAYESTRRYQSLSDLVRHAASLGLINGADQDVLLDSIKLRNSALHRNSPVTKRQAVDAVQVIRRIVEQLGDP
jgi:SIR2-like domain